MALRYWVGGSGTWDGASTTNWSATSGGAGGASVPTTADDVFLNGNSIDLADKFAEMYQGKYGLIGPVMLMSADKSNNVLEFLERQATEIEDARYKVVDKDCTPLQNVIDEIVGLYYTTIYKLKFLA